MAPLLLLLLATTSGLEQAQKGAGLRELYKRWESRRVRVQGSVRELKEREEVAREQEQVDLLGLGEVTVDGEQGGEVVEAAVLSGGDRDERRVDKRMQLKELQQENPEDQQMKDKQQKQKEKHDLQKQPKESQQNIQEDQPMQEEEEHDTVVYIVSGADQKTVVATLTTQEERRSYFRGRVHKHNAGSGGNITFPHFVPNTSTSRVPTSAKPSTTTRRSFPRLASWARSRLAPQAKVDRSIPRQARVHRRRIDTSTLSPKTTAPSLTSPSVSPEAWLAKFYSKTIKSKPSQQLPPSLGPEARHPGHTLRGLLALVEEEEGPTRTGSTSASLAKIKVKPQQASSLTQATTTNERTPTSGSTTNVKTPSSSISISERTSTSTSSTSERIPSSGSTNNERTHTSGSNTSSPPPPSSRVLPQDFLLQMMMLSQDTNTVTGAGEHSQDRQEDDMLALLSLPSPQPPQKIVNNVKSSPLTLSKDNSDTQSSAKHMSFIPDNDQFGDSLVFTFPGPVEARASATADVVHNQFSHNHPSHNHPLQDQSSNDHPSNKDPSPGLPSHRLQVKADFRPALATDSYNTQWLPVFVPSTRTARARGRRKRKHLNIQRRVQH